MADDIFTPVDLPVDDNSDQDYLSELVGEGKKFRDAKELAKSKVHADRHIKTLEEKLDDLRAELKTRTSLEDFMTKMKETQQSGNTHTPPLATPGQEENKGNDSTDLEQKLEELLAERELRSKTESNLNKVTRVMKENFGDDAAFVINKKAQELGMSVEALKSLSVQSPSAFFNLVGAQEDRERVNVPNAPRSTVNTGGSSNFSPMRNAAFYERMKRENPNLYFDQKTTVNMIKDRQALGDKWYS